MPLAAPLLIRPCRDRDIGAVQRIYGHHVLYGLASFEIDPPSEDELAARRRTIIEVGFPYLVGEQGSDVVGYAYAGPYRSRPAYRHTAEKSVYVRHDSVRQRIGARLLAELVPRCEAVGLRQLIAVIGDSGNLASIELHRRADFTTIGTIRSAGCKFGRWVDSVLMQRPLGPGNASPPRALL